MKHVPQQPAISIPGGPHRPPLEHEASALPHPRPLIVCLCGSTRFMQAFQQANLEETLAGRIVLSIGCDTKSDGMLNLSPEVKIQLDELHKRKIDLADEVLVLNQGGYIGSSTAGEIAYAKTMGKRIRWLEPPQGEEHLGRSATRRCTILVAPGDR